MDAFGGVSLKTLGSKIWPAAINAARLTVVTVFALHIALISGREIANASATAIATQTLAEEWGRVRQSKAGAHEKPNKIRLSETSREGCGTVS
jgi:hypothetical protein